MKPPHTWPIRIEGRAASAYNSAELIAAASRLQSRQAADASEFDSGASVKATASALGYPTFEYRICTRVPEYLLLIDRTSARDHQAALFSELVQAMRDNGLHVQHYFFDSDPRICHQENSAAVRLRDLQSKYGDHRVLLLGDADRLIDPITGHFASWVSILNWWSDRAILTPVPVSSWGAREQMLARDFVVLPATTEAMSSLNELFDGMKPRELRNGGSPRAHDLDMSLPPPELVEQIRRDLGEPLFCWLCACAVYPELHWDLTLYLGSLGCFPAGLVTEPNLLRLNLLPWFKTGSIPDDIRVELIRRLTPEQEWQIRDAVIRVIHNNLADEGTFAFERQTLEIAANRRLVSRSRRIHGAKWRLLQDRAQRDRPREYIALRLILADEPIAKRRLRDVCRAGQTCPLYVGNSKIDDFDLLFIVSKGLDHDVFGFKIAVPNSAPVSCLKCPTNLA